MIHTLVKLIEEEEQRYLLQLQQPNSTMQLLLINLRIQELKEQLRLLSEQDQQHQ